MSDPGEYDVMLLNGGIALQLNRSSHHPDQCTAAQVLLYHILLRHWGWFSISRWEKNPLSSRVCYFLFAIITAYVITNPIPVCVPTCWIFMFPFWGSSSHSEIRHGLFVTMQGDKAEKHSICDLFFFLVCRCCLDTRHLNQGNLVICMTLGAASLISLRITL